MQDPRTFCYKFAYAPTFVCEPNPEFVQQFQADIDTIRLDCFNYLRKHSYVSRDTLVSSLYGGITLGEFCLLWIQMRANTLKRNWQTYESKHKTNKQSQLNKKQKI